MIMIMDKLKLHTPDFAEANIAKLAELFPNCVTESKNEQGETIRAIDFDLLKQELSTSVVEGPQERYQLNWPGKREALFAANAPIAKTLRPCRDESVDFDTTQNLYIEGDNLDALKLLKESYLGKVKLIYIDPPYNTGNDFIYEDDFAEDTESYLQRSNQKDEVGNRLVANTESNGRFHSDWLSMMYSRLRLAKSFLTSDGAIFVSCDEVEQARLRLIMDEIFGMNNFIADMVWAAGRKNDSKFISVSHEYIVCYARDKEFLKENKIVWRQRKKGLDEIYGQYEKLKNKHGSNYDKITIDLKQWYKDLADNHPAKAHKHYSCVDERGIFFPDNISSISGATRPRYEIPHPITGLPVAVPSRGWGFTLETLQKLISENRVAFGPDHTTVPTLKSYLKDREYQSPYSVFYQDGRASSKRLRSLMGGDYFGFPKDEEVLQEIIGMITTENDTVMDFFSGSATTAQALMMQNLHDNCNRRYILVQIPEPCDKTSEAFKAGYKFITDIGKKRIRLAGEKIKKDCPSLDILKKLDLGFRVLKIDTSNLKDVFYKPDQLKQTHLDQFTDNIKDDRTAEDLLFQVLLDWGVDLSLPITQETISGKSVFFVDENALAACFDTDINESFVKELAARHPLRAVFRDSGFSNDSLKINVEQVFKLISPSTEIKVL
jgi:adenine-specific DNA-methyltransferase